MDLKIKNKFALVTGASQGLGRAIAAELAKEGARVILVARNAKELAALQSELPGGTAQHAYYSFDLMIPENISRLAETIKQKHNPLDIIVHNLGGSLNLRDPFAPAEEWNKVWRYNLEHVIELNRIFIPLMVERKWGRIVHLSTLGATIFQGNAPYTAAKAALNAYVKCLGREVAKHNVVLNAIAPGAIYRDGRYFAKMLKENPPFMEEWFKQHLPAGRLGTDTEVGQMVAYLCSEQAAFMTGSIVALDGGGM